MASRPSGSTRATGPTRRGPDALYINRGDPYVATLLYDVRRDAFEHIAWGDWLKVAAAARAEVRTR